MDLDLAGKVAVVTAASRGIGRAIAHALAAESASVMIASRNQDQLVNTAAEIAEATGSHVLSCPADVSRAEDIDRLVACVKDNLGGTDILIANAGGPPVGNFNAFGDEDWQTAFELNFMSLVRLIRGVLPTMREKGGGHIVNIASSSVRQPVDNLILSNTFRTATAALSKSLASELAQDSILINTVGPNRIATDRVDYIDNNRARSLGISVEEVRRRSKLQIPLGRYGKPEELARVVTFLASPANSYITGQVLLVDGGMVKAL